MNKLILTGNLSQDVKVRYTQAGTAIATTGVAVNRKWKTQSGELKEEVMFMDIKFFGRTGEIANQYLHKGSKVLVEGRIALEQWKAQDGTNRSKHVLVVEHLEMLGGKGSKETQQRPAPAAGGEEIPAIEVDEDEIPF